MYTDKMLAAYTAMLNLVRRVKGMNEISISHTIFDDMFNDGQPHYIALFSGNKMIARGRLVCSVEKYKEFWLDDFENDVKRIEEKGIEMPAFKRTYFDARTGVLIKEYDMPTF